VQHTDPDAQLRTLSAVQSRIVRLSGTRFQEILYAVLSKGVPVRFQACGFSMHPYIRDLDVVTVSPLPRRSLRVGDVIAFRKSCCGSLVLHRIQRMGPEGLLVRGDNLLAPDGLVSLHDVIGLVTLAERDGAVAYRAADAGASADSNNGKPLGQGVGAARWDGRRTACSSSWLI
jgi:hypothetical protein